MIEKVTSPPLSESADFSTIRQKGFLYVDKTHFIANLIKNHTHIFCSRPRRFGKTLMISTFEALFAGDRKFFHGLNIDSQLNEEFLRPCPVIRLDMNSFVLEDGIESFKKNILLELGLIGKKYNVKPQSDTISYAFRELIFGVSEKYGNVVILIDEYDFPLIESMHNTDLQNQVRETLRGFYMQIKSAEKRVSFTYITGISKFSKVGIFSEFNNLNDISTDSDYAEMFGYTTDEIQKYFGETIRGFEKYIDMSENEILERLAAYYNGYSFDGISMVYNPFSLSYFLNKKEFGYYWVQSGRQKFVEYYLHNKDIDWKKLDGMPISKHRAMEPGEVGVNASPSSVLYQAGYLTLRYDSETRNYRLKYPNLEVLIAMETLQINNYFKSIEDVDAAQNSAKAAVTHEDYPNIIKVFNELFSNISFSNNQSIKDRTSDIKEGFYRGHVISFLRGAEFFVYGEAETNLGKSDIIAKLNGKTLVIEMKYVDAKPDSDNDGEPSAQEITSRCRKKLREAVQQLYNKNYAGPYPNPMILAIVLDESYKGGCISHAAYGNIAYHIHGEPATHTPIGDIRETDNVWSLTWRENG